MKNELLFKFIIHPKTKVNTGRKVTLFTQFNSRVACPEILGSKLVKAIKKKKYNLVRELIDIYTELFETNLY